MAEFSATAENAALGGIKTAATWISLHTADPAGTGASEVSGGSYARVQTTWGTASGGSMSGSQVTINVPASTTIEGWGVWSASTSGTYYAGGLLPANETYAGAGTYLLTPTLTASG